MVLKESADFLTRLFESWYTLNNFSNGETFLYFLITMFIVGFMGLYIATVFGLRQEKLWYWSNIKEKFIHYTFLSLILGIISVVFVTLDYVIIFMVLNVLFGSPIIDINMPLIVFGSIAFIVAKFGLIKKDGKIKFDLINYSQIFMYTTIGMSFFIMGISLSLVSLIAGIKSGQILSGLFVSISMLLGSNFIYVSYVQMYLRIIKSKKENSYWWFMPVKVRKKAEKILS